jgi:ABC-type Mn2+/Zn2+ transport system ATPase subunit
MPTSESTSEPTSESTSDRSFSPAAPADPLVTAIDVCVHYGSTIALAPTSFTVGTGTSVALVGSNGSGKTTVLSLMAGLVKPTDGTIEVAGTAAMVTQSHHHHRWMPLTVDEVLRMGRYRARGLMGRITADDREQLADAAERLEVGHLRRRPFGELSGGQQQRVLVAQALAARPDLLLLDEPITGLDLPSQLRILDVIADHAAAGGTVVFSTHHLAEARRAGRVMLLAGCVLADGVPDEVLVPALLAEAFGGRLIRDGGAAIVVDDHGHDEHVHGAELVPHHAVHPHQHEHGESHHVHGERRLHAGDHDAH